MDAVDGDFEAEEEEGLALLDDDALLALEGEALLALEGEALFPLLLLLLPLLLEGEGELDFGFDAGEEELLPGFFVAGPGDFEESLLPEEARSLALPAVAPVVLLEGDALEERPFFLSLLLLPLSRETPSSSSITGPQGLSTMRLRAQMAHGIAQRTMKMAARNWGHT